MTKDGKTLLLWEYVLWADKMVEQFGCTHNEIGEVVLGHERKFERLREEIREGRPV